MTISTQSNISIAQGNGVTVNFPFFFKTQDASQLIIERRVKDTGEVDKTYSASEYSVTGIGENSGTVTLLVPPSADYEVIIRRQLAYTQDMDIVNQGGFQPEVLEQQLDSLVMQIQQIAERVARSIVVASGSALNELPSKNALAGYFLTFDADGNPSVTSGTGADGTLRSDIASSDPAKGGSLIGTPLGISLGREIAARIGARTQANLEALLSADDGTVVSAGGLLYLRDDTAIDADSAGNDVGVDGLVPFGVWTPGHFGSLTNLTADAAGRVIRGRGILYGTGAEITNVTNAPVLQAIGTGTGKDARKDHVRFEDMQIYHEAGLTEPAVKLEQAAFNQLTNLYIETFNGAGGAETGVRAGHGSGTALTQQAYEPLLINVTARGFEENFRFQSGGSGAMLINCFSYAQPFSTTECDAVFSTANVRIIGGQYKKITFNNVQAGQDFQFSIEHLSMESIDAGKYGIKVTGDGAFSKGFMRNIMFNGAVVAGTGVDLDNTRQTEAILRCKNPTAVPAGGYLLRFGAGARECVVYMDPDTAKAPIVADPAALRNVKAVTGLATRADSLLAGFSPYVTTLFTHGIVELSPDFRPAHNGAALNYQLLTLADDTAVAFLAPAENGTLSIQTSGDKTCNAILSYDADGTAPVIMAGAGDIEVGTGVLTGTIGTNNKITVSTATAASYTQKTGVTSTTVFTLPAATTWLPNQLVGKVITNVTDGSTGYIVSNTTTTATVATTPTGETPGMSGGADNTFQPGDTVTIAGWWIYVEQRKGSTNTKVTVKMSGILHL